MNEVEKIIYDRKRKTYKRTDLSLRERFWEGEKDSEYWLRGLLGAIKEEDPIKKKELIEKFTFSGKLSVDLKRESIDRLIDKFTKQAYTDEQIDADIEACNKAGVFANGKRADRRALVFDLNGKEVIVRSLLESIPMLKTYFPELATKERNCKCHEGSIRLTRFLGLKNIRVSTGSYYIVSPNSMVLHSVAEADIEGNPYVLDYDSNTLWEKEDFYKFYNFEPFESISQKTLNEDLNDLLFLMEENNDYAKLYLTSRDEAINIAKMKQEEKE